MHGNVSPCPYTVSSRAVSLNTVIRVNISNTFDKIIFISNVRLHVILLFHDD
jgi:hypothetical protein